MKRFCFFTAVLVALCVMVNAQSGEEMLKRAISTNPTNKWGNGMQKGQWTNSSNMSAYLWSNGTMYLGNFFGNKCHGYGINIQPEGYSINNCPKAKYYVGNWSNGEKSGTGTCYDESGTLIYYGEFKNDKPTDTYPTTDSYASYKFQTLNYTNDKYVGETKDGERHGYGVYAWKDGRIWIGNWKDGARAGQGIDIASNGSLKTGYWDNDTYRMGEAERQAEERRQREEQSARLQESLGQLAASVAQYQQSHGGGNTGSYSGGQNQSGASSGSSSADASNYQTMYNRHAKQVESIAKSLLPLNGTDSTKSSYNSMVRTMRDHQRDMKSIRRECESKRIHIETNPYWENYNP